MTNSPAAAAPPPSGPPPVFWALGQTMTAEANRRLRRAFLIAVGVGLLAVFALGASILPTALTADLLLSYLVFLAAFGISLALALLAAWSGPYADAIAVAEIARIGTMRAWEEAVGERHVRPLAAPGEAAAWLRAHPDSERIRPQRFSAQILAGDLRAARETLARYPDATPFERYWKAADAWLLDVLEGRPADLAAVEAQVEGIEDPAQRAHGESGLAALRAHQALLAGSDWIAPFAEVQARVAAFVDPALRIRIVVRLWVSYMVVAAGGIGIALIIARLTGVWGTDVR